MPCRYYSDLGWQSAGVDEQVEQVRARLRAPRWLSTLELVWRLWMRSRRRDSAGLVEASPATLAFCILRSFLPARGIVVLFGFYLNPSSGLKKKLLRRALGSVTACVVWSRRQAENYARETGLPVEHFPVVKYKANHSQATGAAPLLPGDYVFSGGDSERDYATLFKAVSGLDIPVLVSTTDPGLVAGIEVPPNVILLQAREPYYERLMASARIVVIPLRAGRLRGAGEASFLNAMWHGRPVICADDVSAPEYVEHGVDGLVVPPGDARELRDAIAALWNDREKAASMGRQGRAKVEAGYTHEMYCRRLLATATNLAARRS